jgi:uncharacterized protein
MTLSPHSSTRRLLALLCLLALASCRRDAEPSPPPSPEPDPAETAEGVPLERLYGASPEENLRLLPLELEVPDLPAGWEGGRIAILAEPRVGSWRGNTGVLAAALRRVAAERPVAVLMIGSFLSAGQSAEPLERPLAELRGIPAFAVLGPRDVRTDSIEARVVRALSQSNVRVLRNARAPLGRGNDTIDVGGLDPDLATDPDWRRAQVLAALSGGRSMPILLSHHPALAVGAPEGAFPLIVAGNTFCGTVEAPGTPRLSWYREEGLQLQHYQLGEMERLFRVRGNTLFLTCGIGFGYLPMRVGAPPEIVMVTLRRPGEVEPPEEDTAGLDTLLQQLEEEQPAVEVPPATGAEP